MAEQVIPLTTLSETQLRQALERFVVLRPAPEEGISQTQIARDHQIALSTVQRWIKSYREKGLAGLAPATRLDKGKSRSLPEQAITLVEGLVCRRLHVQPMRFIARWLRLLEHRDGNHPAMSECA